MGRNALEFSGRSRSRWQALLAALAVLLPAGGASAQSYTVDTGLLRPPADVPYRGAPQPAADPIVTGAIPTDPAGGRLPPLAAEPSPAVPLRPPVDLGANPGAASEAEPRGSQGQSRTVPEQFRRQLVDYPTSEPAGTIVIDTPHTYLYLVLGNGKAIRYGVGVGREGFTWAGRTTISRMAEWPDWRPPNEMIERQPYLPRFMAGGPGNPMGARALYLGHSIYRIHGTNEPNTIGTFVSSGCIRLVDTDIEDLYQRVSVGTRVVVLPDSAHAARR